jgi:hypothetical protein
MFNEFKLLVVFFMILRCYSNKFKLMIVLFVLLRCCFNKFKLLVVNLCFWSVVSISSSFWLCLLKCCFIKFKLLAMFFMFLKSILAFCDFWILVVVSVLLSHQVLASTCVLEIHVGLLDLVFMFLRCFHFSFNYSEPSSCSPLVK